MLEQELAAPLQAWIGKSGAAWSVRYGAYAAAERPAPLRGPISMRSAEGKLASLAGATDSRTELEQDALLAL